MTEKQVSFLLSSQVVVGWMVVVKTTCIRALQHVQQSKQQQLPRS